MATRLKYVNKDHSHPLRGKTGTCLVRSKGPGPRNILVKLDDGQLVVAPWGNWRRLLPAGEMQSKNYESLS